MIAALLIRADDSPSIGSGHAMRCLALAQEWRRRGGRVIIVAVNTTSSILKRIEAAGVESQVISAEAGSEEDAAKTVSIAQANEVTWIVADGYVFGTAWQCTVKTNQIRLLVLDDHGFCDDFRADYILNQNASASGIDYNRRTSESVLLLGNRYTLLRSEFFSWSTWQREIPPIARNVLVTLGGSDPDNVTEKVLTALSKVNSVRIKVVVGGSNPHLAGIQELAVTMAHSVEIEIDSQRMPELMAWADVAISAAGSTAWELAFMGLPAVFCVLGENQSGIASELQACGLAINLGDHRGVEPAQITASVNSLLADEPTRRAMSERGRKRVDGYGASRVAAALGAPLKITLVSDADSWFSDYITGLYDSFQAAGHTVTCVHEPAQIPHGDLSFLLSLGRLVSPAVLRRNAHNLVVHGSQLPQGRGWSPITWQILAGQNEIPMTLLEAGEGADTGEIYATDKMQFQGDELVEEIRVAQAESTARLCRDFIQRYPIIVTAGQEQTGPSSWYPRRRAIDSKLDPDKTLREQFNQLRVADADRYPAFFELAGFRYEIRLTKKGAIAP